MKKRGKPEKTRPMPPAGLGEAETEWRAFAPAPDIEQWVRENLLAEDGPLYNPDHQHLVDADVKFLWAAGGFNSKGRTVVGTAEEVAFRCNAWQRQRQEQQMREWFGHVPDYVVTIAGSYSLMCSDAEWCALVEHELYHIAHKKEMGVPIFTKDGKPKIGIVGHDVEEFVGVVRRYGVGNPAGNVARLVRAAQQQPEVSRLNLAHACGTCLLRAA